MDEPSTQLSKVFANSFKKGDRFETITAAQKLAEPVLKEKIDSGTLTAKLVDESIERGLIQAARSVLDRYDSLQGWEQCLDLYDRQPPLNTRTSTSVLQQAYSTPVPIAYLAGKLAGIDQDTSVYEPTAGNGALLLLADPNKAIVNELNPDRANALRQQGFTVTEHDASVFSPQLEPLDSIITNPPFGSLKDDHGQTRIFRQGRLTTSQVDHAIALKALDLMKPDGRAVLILGGKMGNEQSRAERYNTQLTRGFYRWLYKDAGYNVADHFSIAGSLYRKQGTSFPIDVILIQGRGETQLKLPGVRPPRIYENYADLKEVLVHAINQQSAKQNKNPGILLQYDTSVQALDTATSQGEHTRPRISSVVDIGNRSFSTGDDSITPGISSSSDAAGGMVDRRGNSELARGVRTTEREGGGVVDSQRNINLLAELPQSSRLLQHPSADERISSNELPGITGELLPDLGATVPHYTTQTRQHNPELPARHESNRLASLDERGREPTSPIVELMSETNEARLVSLQEESLDNQVAYTPRSKAKSLGTLAPAASLKGLENVFNKIEACTGLTVDEYVQTRLKEPSLEELYKHYAAEQIDSLALSIYNYEYERKATLIGHDTGIGKTRIVCGLARYAQKQELTPVIVTADPVLYSDILARDAVDTGNYFNPLLTNNGMKLTLKSPNGEEIGEVSTPKNHIERIREYTALSDIGEHDSVFTTYGQMTGPSSIERRQLLEALAPRTLLILDESHKAGGAAGEQRPKTKAEIAREQREDYVPSCTEFFQKLVIQTPGFVASSATAIKDPIVAARLFYETTDLKLAAADRDTFTDHLKAGGVPLQQMVFAKWAESGGCIRCEKSYEGVEFSAQTVPVSLETAENNAKILNLIWRFDKVKNGVVREINSELADAGEVARDKNSALGDAGAASTNFTSVLHNLTAVASLGLKAAETANAVIRDIEQGRKPIVMLFNTMESVIKNFIDTHNELVDIYDAESPDSPMQRIGVGDTISIDAGELFSRYLEKSRTIKITEPYLNETTGKQQTRSYQLTDEDLGQVGVTAYNKAAAAIAAADWSQLPISPIDYIKQKVEDAGYSMGEITGRTHILKYESVNDIQSGIVTYQTREHGTAQKKQVMDGFQNGALDAIITNSTTGYSLHASRTVPDQRQRVMYLVQPHLDVNQVEQSIGRSHRSGQVDPAKHAPDCIDEKGSPVWGQYPGSFGLPVFKLVVGKDLPTEERSVAILMKKMAHLKANTTGNRSSSFGLKNMPDYVNAYGNEVAQKLMQTSPELHADLDNPLGYGEELSAEKAIQKVTGRAVMLSSDKPPTPDNPYPSLSRQAWLYDTLSSDYQEFLAQKIALGENNLEAQKLDLQAEPRSRLVLSPGDPTIDSPFTKPAYLVEVLAKTGAKPNTTLQVANAVRGELGFDLIADLSEHDDYERSDVRQKGQEIAQLTVDGLHGSANAYLADHTQSKELEMSVGQARVGKIEEKLNAQIAIQIDLSNRLRQAEVDSSTLLVDQLKAQTQQQPPKIEKLKVQLNKAQLDLHGKKFQLAKMVRTSKADLEDVSDLLQTFPVGQPVHLMDNATKNSLYGVVAAVEQKGRSQYPATPSNWKLKLLVVDGVRSLSIGFDSLCKTDKHSLEPIETAPSFNDFRQDTSVYNLFDEWQTEAKEKRFLVSGQVLATELTGKFAQVTDNQGQLHPVYLLKRGFDPTKDLDKKPINLENSEQIKQFLFDATRKLGVLQTEDENLTVVADIKPANPGGIVLKTPKATSQGGLYFKDEGLLTLTGDFVSKIEAVREAGKTKSQSVMTVSVSAEQVDNVLNYVAQKWNIGAASHKQEAKKLLGKDVPAWEPCDSINPDVEQKLTVRTPQVSVVTSSNLQQVNNSTGDALINSFVQNAAIVVYPISDSEAQSAGRNRQEAEISTSTGAHPVQVTKQNRAAFEELDSSASSPLLDESKQLVKQIASPARQTGAVEKNVAQLLYQSGLTAEILKGEDFYLKVENKPFIALSIERQGQELYLTHFLEDNSGDLFIDAEMVFQISDQGQLSLSQTAVQNPLLGGEYRRNDREFAKTFSNNLLEQNFVAATTSAFQTKEQLQGAVTNEVATTQLETVSEEFDVGEPAPLVELELPIDQKPGNSELLFNHPSESSPAIIQRANKPSVTKKTKQPVETNSVQLSLFDVEVSALGSDLVAFRSLAGNSEHVVTSVPATASNKESVENRSKPLILPVRDDDKWPEVRSYLQTKWGVPFLLTDGLHKKGLIYADGSANPVFLKYSGNNWNREEVSGAIVWDTSKETYTMHPSDRDEGSFWLSTGKGGELPRIVLVGSPHSAITRACFDKINKLSTDINIYMALDNLKAIPLADLKSVLARGGQVEVGFDDSANGNQMAIYVLEQLPEAKRVISQGNDQNLSLVVNSPILGKAAKPIGDLSLRSNAKLVSPIQIFQQQVDRVDKQTGEFLTSTPSLSPSLETLRQWYRISRNLGKSQRYLDHIAEVANQFKSGQPLSEKALDTMQQDFSLYQIQSGEQSILTAQAQLIDNCKRGNSSDKLLKDVEIEL